MGWTPKVTQNPARWGLCQRNLPAALAPAGQAGTHLPRCPSAYTLELGGPSREGLGGGGLCDPWLLTPGPIFPRSPLPPWAGLIFLHLDLPCSLWMGLCPSACTPTFPQTFLKHTWDHTPPFLRHLQWLPTAWEQSLSPLPRLQAFVQVPSAQKWLYRGRRR